LSRNRRRRSRRTSNGRADLGLVGLVLAGIVSFAIGSFLRDHAGVPYNFFGGFFWVVILLITFATVLFYLAQFVLPRDDESDSWIEGTRMIWRHYVLRGDLFLKQYFPDPDDNKKQEESKLPVSFKKLKAGFVPSHEVLAIARGKEFRRPAGPGFVVLAKGEHVKELIDLRPHARSQQIKANTRDGIPVEATVGVTFEVWQLTSPPDNDLRPYPYDRQAIFPISYLHSMGEGDKPQPWTEQVCPQAAALVVEKLATYPLDRLYNSGENGRLLLSEIGQEIKEEMEKELQKKGINLIGVGIGHLQPPSPIKEQRIRSWQAGWERKITVREGHRQANVLRSVKLKRAQAQVEIINNILESIDATHHIEDSNLSEIIMLRMLEVLEQTAQDVMVRKLSAERGISELVLDASSEMRQLLRGPEPEAAEEETSP
jgi:hypothetical protein